ncbi:MAG: glycine cleavage system protein GcvH [Dehalococcoidia bacterium]|nr:glycine cleavage system protein GcvH [Dehalococcoidia bacterium]
MSVPDTLRYTNEHEWVRLDADDTGVIGITAHAQDQLGDIVFVELPAPGDRVTQFEKFGEVESVKAVSDLFSPVSGEVVEVNAALTDQPELVNGSPYEKGWLLRLRLSDTAELDKLMSAPDYDRFVQEELGD